ncbi:MAG: hypothetical protein ACI4P7_06635 [Bacilli bacterium]
MKNFNWEEFKRGNIAVHCDTEEKAKDFLKECDTKGIKFKVRNRTTEGTNSWKWYKEQTIYCINNNKLLYSSYLERRAIGYKIIEWEIDTMKELKSLEVMANIEEGQAYKCTRKNARVKAIKRKIIDNKDVIEFLVAGKCGYSSFAIEVDDTFTLHRKEYTFQEAFKAYEEGKEIESLLYGLKLKKKCGKDYYYDYAKEKYVCIECIDIFTIDSIREKWYIND